MHYRWLGEPASLWTARNNHSHFLERCATTPRMLASRSMNARIPRTAGFSLVEIAFVLIIAGIFVAGVVVGRDLIASSRVVRVIKEQEAWQAAISGFRERYEDLPGDMTDATTYWSGATANGNGNRQILWTGGEGPQAWYQLEQSGYIPPLGMTGTATSNLAVIGTNVPNSAFRKSAGWYIHYDAAKGGNHLGFGEGDAASVNDTAAIMPTQAYRVDKKLDDGDPASGHVRSSGDSSCVNAGEYVLSGGTVESITCAMTFVIAAGTTL